MPADKRLNLVAAVDQQLAIGYGNRLPWSISGDLRFFRRLTWGHSLVMGRATFDSLGRRPLPGRLNVVLSRGHHQSASKGEGPAYADSIEAALARCPAGKQVFFIGGSSVYEQIIGSIDCMYLTHINGRFAADTWFPEFNAARWRASVIEDHWSDLPNGWRVVRYEPLPSAR